MTSHFSLLVVFALFTSVVFAVLMRDDAREQLRFGARLLGGFIGAAIVLSWLLYALPL
jgi:hypothetical protein